jgi:hypothetical protein
MTPPDAPCSAPITSGRVTASAREAAPSRAETPGHGIAGHGCHRDVAGTNRP